MNPRERFIITIIGGVIGAWALYLAVNAFCLAPVRSADRDLANLSAEYSKLKRERDALPQVAKIWSGFAKRTYSFDERETQNAFGEELKRLATSHKLSGAQFTPRSGTKIGRTDVRTIAFQVVADGRLEQVTSFLRDLYELPVLIRLHKLHLAPTKQVGGSDEIKITELIVETPVLSRFEAVHPVQAALRSVTTMPADPAFKPGSLRRGIPSLAEYALFRERNIFKAYEPPPKFAITIDNQDLKSVQVSSRFTWRGEAGPAPSMSVTGKSKQDLADGVGDEVELTATYSDGKTFGPQKLRYGGLRAAVFTVPAHTPPPPPETFVYKVRNDADEPVDVSVSFNKGSITRTLPLMKVPTRQTIDLPDMTADRLTLAGIYVDGTRATPGIYEVRTAAVGTYVVPKRQANAAKPVANLPKGDADQVVTGLLRYPGAEEMIVLNTKTKQRQVIALGKPVEGGELLMVHPLGGVVRMTDGTFVLYPLGRKFAERVVLAARTNGEIEMAINEWNRP